MTFVLDEAATPGAWVTLASVDEGQRLYNGEMDEKLGELPRRTNDGLFSIMLRPCTAEVLRHLLDPDVPFVWIVGHQPDRIAEWWSCYLPLSKDGKSYPLEVRQLCYDVLMSTTEFLTRLTEFDGLTLYQMRNKVPNTLIVERLEERNRVPVLVQNGLAAAFYLPHAHECAQFATVERRTIERCLRIDVVRRLAY